MPLLAGISFDWLLIPCIVYLPLYLLYMVITNPSAIYVSYTLLYKNAKKDSLDSYPPVSIIKPLAGPDVNLKVNLETYFNLKYPKYEILFCTQSEDDPSLRTVKELMEEYPNVDVQVFANAPDVVVNPKINNMLQGYGAAKYKLLWMVDANILVTPDTLQEMVVCSESGTDVGLVHQVPFWATKPTFASALNQVYFGGPHARIYLASNALGAVCASGMSFMLKKSVLEDIGGLEHFGQYLAEDFFLARDLRKKGYKIILSSLPALQNPGACSVELFKARLSRWIRLRTSMIPFPSLLEPLIDCFVMGLLSSLVFSYLLGYSFFLFYGFHICIVMVSDYILLRNLQNGPLLNWKMLFLAWWVRELLALPIYLHGVSSRKVWWKDREFTLMCGGQVKETTPPPKHIISV